MDDDGRQIDGYLRWRGWRKEDGGREGPKYQVPRGLPTYVRPINLVPYLPTIYLAIDPTTSGLLQIPWFECPTLLHCSSNPS